MDVGMLWFDNNKEDLLKKLDRAATYYNKKYGGQPNLCFVHPQTLNGNPLNDDGVFKAGTIEVRTSMMVLPHHFWMGKKNKIN